MAQAAFEWPAARAGCLARARCAAPGASWRRGCGHMRHTKQHKSCSACAISKEPACAQVLQSPNRIPDPCSPAQALGTAAVPLCSPALEVATWRLCCGFCHKQESNQPPTQAACNACLDAASDKRVVHRRKLLAAAQALRGAVGAAAGGAAPGTVADGALCRSAGRHPAAPERACPSGRQKPQPRASRL